MMVFGILKKKRKVKLRITGTTVMPIVTQCLIEHDVECAP